MRTCFEYLDGAFPVRLQQISALRFRVEYGLQTWEDLSYKEAAHHLGKALMHCAACDGNLINEYME